MTAPISVLEARLETLKTTDPEWHSEEAKEICVALAVLRRFKLELAGEVQKLKAYEEASYTFPKELAPIDLFQ